MTLDDPRRYSAPHHLPTEVALPLPIDRALGRMVGWTNTPVPHRTDGPKRPEVKLAGNAPWTKQAGLVWLAGRRSLFCVRPCRPTIQPRTAPYRGLTWLVGRGPAWGSQTGHPSNDRP